MNAQTLKIHQDYSIEASTSTAFTLSGPHTKLHLEQDSETGSWKIELEKRDGEKKQLAEGYSIQKALQFTLSFIGIGEASVMEETSEGIQTFLSRIQDNEARRKAS